jgi:hypothetical protein
MPCALLHVFARRKCVRSLTKRIRPTGLQPLPNLAKMQHQTSSAVQHSKGRLLGSGSRKPAQKQEGLVAAVAAAAAAAVEEAAGIVVVLLLAAGLGKGLRI